MHEVCWGSRSFATKLETRIYDPDDPDKPEQVTRGMISKRDGIWYCAWDHSELLIHPELVILVSHDLEMITMQEVEYQVGFVPEEMMQRVVSMLEKYKEPVFTTQDDIDCRCYRVRPAESWITDLEICIEKETGWISRLDYVYQEARSGKPGRVETSFFETRLTQDLQEDHFNLEFFVNKSENGWVPAARLAGYRFVH